MTEQSSDGSSEIQDWRDRIDAIDMVIANLLAERARCSTRIQDVRIRSGGPRTDLVREREVIATYAEALGREGGDIAHSVLVFCRKGARDAVDRQFEGAALPFHGGHRQVL